MSDTLAAPSAGHEVAYPPAISLHDAWPWMLFGAALLALLYFVGLDEGAASVVPGHSVHEWLHDGRHLLGFPCH
jgi:Probable cobalt transporter subunit (CbtB)